MHGSLHLILATESERSRQAAGREARLAASIRRPFATVAARVAAAHGIPPRAVPSHQGAASLRGR
jgi:hypothetical protein